MRQPQASSAAVDMLAAKVAPTAEPSGMPAVEPEAPSAPIKPRRLSGACSTSNTFEAFVVWINSLCELDVQVQIIRPVW